MEKPKVVSTAISTQYYNWSYSGKSYRFVVQEDKELWKHEVRFEVNSNDDWFIIFQCSIGCPGKPSFDGLAELTMRQFAEMFGIEYKEEK